MEKKTNLLGAKVSAELKQIIQRVAEQHGMDASKCVRGILALYANQVGILNSRTVAERLDVPNFFFGRMHFSEPGDEISPQAFLSRKAANIRARTSAAKEAADHEKRTAKRTA